MRSWAVLLICGFALCAADEEEAKRLPDGPGKDVTAKVCIDCHGAANFRKVRLNRDAWSDKVADMVDRGAAASEDEVKSIVDYLARNFGPGAKVNMNAAPMAEIKAVLGFSVAEATAIVNYREANGKFEDWRAVMKVPGVDGKRVEEKRELMGF